MMTRTPFSRRCGTLTAIALTGAIALAGCTTERQLRGYVIDQQVMDAVTVGLDNRLSVKDLLGNPSVKATFSDSVWYYIRSQTQKRSFLDEEAREQTIVAIAFDDSGTVSEVRRYSLADARDVDPVNDETPTRGKTLGFFEQIFGNIGRFAGQGAPGPGGPGGPNSPN